MCNTHLITNTAAEEPGDNTVSPDRTDNRPSPTELCTDTPEDQQTTNSTQEESGGDEAQFEGTAVEVKLAEEV